MTLVNHLSTKIKITHSIEINTTILYYIIILQRVIKHDIFS